MVSHQYDRLYPIQGLHNVINERLSTQVNKETPVVVTSQSCRWLAGLFPAIIRLVNPRARFGIRGPSGYLAAAPLVLLYAACHRCPPPLSTALHWNSSRVAFDFAGSQIESCIIPESPFQKTIWSCWYGNGNRLFGRRLARQSNDGTEVDRTSFLHVTECRCASFGHTAYPCC